MTALSELSTQLTLTLTLLSLKFLMSIEEMVGSKYLLGWLKGSSEIMVSLKVTDRSIPPWKSTQVKGGDSESPDCLGLCPSASTWPEALCSFGKSLNVFFCF